MVSTAHYSVNRPCPVASRAHCSVDILLCPEVCGVHHSVNIVCFDIFTAYQNVVISCPDVCMAGHSRQMLKVNSKLCKKIKKAEVYTVLHIIPSKRCFV